MRTMHQAFEDWKSELHGWGLIYRIGAGVLIIFGFWLLLHK
jgi:hypothetical protein